MKPRGNTTKSTKKKLSQKRRIDCRLKKDLFQTFTCGNTPYNHQGKLEEQIIFVKRLSQNFTRHGLNSVRMNGTWAVCCTQYFLHSSQYFEAVAYTSLTSLPPSLSPTLSLPLSLYIFLFREKKENSLDKRSRRKLSCHVSQY